METESCKGQSSTQLGTEDTRVHEEHDLFNSLATPTPEKPEWSSKRRAISSLARKQLTEDFQNGDLYEGACSDCILPKDKSVELPEKYKLLADFFNRMETSIRLLGLRKLLPTFRSICRQVEILTKRKFLYNHIAQMKYVFPEAFQIEKILVHDQESLLMIPDMKITLLKDIVGHPLPQQSASMVLCEAFRARLFNFFISHPEGTDIPEAMLPEPFNEGDHGLPIKTLTEEAGIEPPAETSSELVSFSNASHLSSSFHRQFSGADIVPETHKTQLLVTKNVSAPLTNRDETEEDGNSRSLDVSSSTLIIDSPARVRCTPNPSTVSQCSESTPAKGPSHFQELITDTPAQQTPKRPVPTPQQKLSAENEVLITEARLTTSARRSLMYSPANNKVSGCGQVVNTTQSGKFNKYPSDQDASAKRSLWDKEDTGYDKPISEMVHSIATGKCEELGDNKRCEMLACLLETFEAICFISQSTNSSVITKEELVHKILSINLEIEETREVEEHLCLLEHLFPDWISKQETVSNGQLLYCIRQTSEREAFRARLVEAV